MGNSLIYVAGEVADSTQIVVSHGVMRVQFESLIEMIPSLGVIALRTQEAGEIAVQIGIVRRKHQGVVIK